MKSIKLILAALAAAALTSAAVYADDNNNCGSCYVLIMKYHNGATIPLYHYQQPTLAVYSGQSSVDPNYVPVQATNSQAPAQPAPRGPVALEETNAPYSIQLNFTPHGQQFFLYRNNAPSN